MAMFDKIHTSLFTIITAAALGVFALYAAPSPASASMCGVTIYTAWTTGNIEDGVVVPGTIDTGTTLSEGSFVACSTTVEVDVGDGNAGTSTLAGAGVESILEDPPPVRGH
jgi:hypothetical protein